jgi:hypothetical protein
MLSSSFTTVYLAIRGWVLYGAPKMFDQEAMHIHI